MARHNFKKGPFEAYEGEEPYIFISYKHADSEIVFPIIKQFHDAGFNIWYDDGLKYGADYDDLIDYKIDNSSLFVICITKKVIEGAYDPKEYMKKELDVAIDTDTKMFPIFLEDVKLKGKYRMQLKGMHSIFKHEHTDEEFLKKCITAFKEDFGIEPNETINKDIHDLNEDENTPFKAYSYIYASYPHNDEENALSDIKRFQEDGYNVFYNPGSDYNNQIANAIANSSLFVVFISNNSVESIYIQNEIMLALSEKIPIIPIYLEKTELKGGLKPRLKDLSPINKFSMTEDEYAKSYAEVFEEFGLKKSPNRNNFKYLDDLIRDNEEITLESDIIFDDEDHENGIDIKKDNLIIDGNGYTIDAKSKARIFNISAENVQLKNITFLNGKSKNGGALFIDSKTNLSIDSCKFKNNYADDEGGSIFNQGNVRISESIFFRNNSKNRGGAITNAENANMNICMSEFNENQGLDGGSITNYNKIDINETVFYKNIANDDGGALVNFNECTIKYCDFTHNEAHSPDDPIDGNGGGALHNYKGSFVIIGSKFYSNSTNNDGGAVSNNYGQTIIDSSDFKNNKSKSKGNSIMNNDESLVKINKSTFSETKSKEIHSKGTIEFVGDNEFKEEVNEEKFIEAFNEFKMNPFK